MAFKAPSTAPSDRELRLFGRLWLPLAGVFIGLLSWRAWGGTPTGAAMIVGGCLVLGWAGSLAPAVLRWPYVALTHAAFPIGWLIGHTVLALAYFVFLTPVALFMRARGRDRLGLRPDPEALTYWAPRAEPDPAAKRYFDPY